MAKPAINFGEIQSGEAGKQTILLEASRAEVNEMQISGQADVVDASITCCREQFSAASCLANLQFYGNRALFTTRH